MYYAAKTDTGKVRKNNEDCIYAKENILIIADGMGGHNAGEVASSIAVETVASALENVKEDYREKIELAIIAANKKVHEMATDERAGMGTTIDVCVYKDGVLHLGHVGDSRVYIIRDGEALRITKDHSYVEMLLSKGEITKEEADDYPMKNMITRAVGVGESVKCDYCATEIKEEDKILLCTDGLTNMLKDDEIAKIVAKAKTIDEAAEQLVLKANDAGGKDNISVIIAGDF